jgi:hypothetical protein
MPISGWALRDDKGRPFSVVIYVLTENDILSLKGRGNACKEWALFMYFSDALYGVSDCRPTADAHHESPDKQMLVDGSF